MNRPALTVNTALPPAPVAGKPLSAKRTTVPPSPSLSPRISSTATTPKTSSSVTSSKRSSPRCSSPACAAVDRMAWLHTSKPSTPGSPPPPLPKPEPISTELYFRLLKKSHVLDQLLHIHSHLATQEQELRRLEADRARADSVHAHVFHELDLYKRQFVETQQYMLELVEAMTALMIQENELARGTGTQEAQQIAHATKEDVVVRDLEHHVSEIQRHDKTPGVQCLESSALRAVGLERVAQLTGVCTAYEMQLKKSESELSQAMHAAYKDECLAKLKQYEAAQQQHDNEKKALSSRIDNLVSQTHELQGVIDDQRDELALLRQTNGAYAARYEAQTIAIERFGAELKTELRRRYGVVPCVLDTRWHTFFPMCTIPE